MSKLKDFYNKYLAWINKYVLVTIGVFILMCLDSDSNLYKRYMYDEKIRSLEKEIEKTVRNWKIYIPIKKGWSVSPVRNIS